MVTVVFVGAAVLLLAWILAMPWLGSAERQRHQRKAQSGTIGPFDELFHPAAYQANIIWEVQMELPAPAPLPGDKAVMDGTIVIQAPPV